MGLAPKAIHAVIVATLRKNVTSYATIKRMLTEFKHGKESLEVDPHSGEPLTETTPEIITKVNDMASSVGVSQEIVHSILTEDLNMRKLSARWVLRLLTVDQRHTIQNMSLANLNLFETDPEKFLLRCVTMDEIWVKHFIPESK